MDNIKNDYSLDMSKLVNQLRVKAGVIEMGERIACGSDAALMREAADRIEALEEVERERNELAAQVNKLRETIELIAKWNSRTTELAVNYGLNGVRDFYRRIAESSLSEQPPSALAALKAQWQAEAVRDFEAMLSSFTVTAEDWIEQRAQEASDA